MRAHRCVNGERVHGLRLKVKLADQRDRPARLRRRLPLPNREEFLRLLKTGVHQVIFSCVSRAAV